MSRGVLGLLLALALAGCSTRSVVVKPDEVSRLNDAQWTIKSEPAARPR
jgi:hypothetical protein